MHFTVMMVPMLQRVLYTPRILLLIHVLMWGMFALQVQPATNYNRKKLLI